MVTNPTPPCIPRFRTLLVIARGLQAHGVDRWVPTTGSRDRLLRCGAAGASRPELARLAAALADAADSRHCHPVHGQGRGDKGGGLCEALHPLAVVELGGEGVAVAVDHQGMYPVELARLPAGAAEDTEEHAVGAMENAHLAWISQTREAHRG
jgi:hypothetical protein